MEAEPALEAGSGAGAENVDPQKPRLKRPVKPDKLEHQAAVDQLQNELNKRRTKWEELGQRVQQKRQTNASPEAQALRTKQNGLSGDFRAEVEKKTVLREKMKALDANRQTLRGQIRDQRSKLGAFMTVQKITERVHALEHRVEHTTMGLKDEAKVREEIKKTAELKPVAAAFEANQEKLKASDKERESILDQIKELDQKIDGIKVQRDKLEAEMTELKQKEAAKVQDVPAMIKERDECREVMNAVWEKIQQLRADFKVKNNEFWEESKVWKEQQNQERAERNAQREKEYQERQAERRAAAAEFAGEPYHKEVGLCDQLLSHLAKYTQQGQSQASEPSTIAATNNTGAAFEGMKALPKGKKEDDEFGAFMGSASGKKGKGKKGKQASGSQIQASQKLNHSLDMIDAFSQLKVSVPTTTDKVPAAVEEVQASKTYWLKKREEVKETGVMPDEPTKSTANGVAKAPKAPKDKAPTSFNLADQEFPDIPGHINASKEAKDSSAESAPESKEEEASKPASEATVVETSDRDDVATAKSGAEETVKMNLEYAGDAVKVAFS